MVTRRAAFDIGSGATKVLVAEVDVANRKIIRELFGQERPVSFKGDSLRSPDGSLSAAVQEEGFQALASLLELAHAHARLFVSPGRRGGRDSGTRRGGRAGTGPED